MWIRHCISTLFFLAFIYLLISLNSRFETPDFKSIEAGETRKQAFIDYIVPVIERKNQQIEVTRQWLQKTRQQGSSLGWWQQNRVSSLAQEYKIQEFEADNDADWQKLMTRVDVIPVSMAVAQAANESAWGTSRFAVDGNNYFGHWCFEPGCGLVPKNRDPGKSHEVAVFLNLHESVEKYIANINSHPAYKEFRKKRKALRNLDENVDGLALVQHLEHYSSRGEEYVKELQAIIRYNDLDRFDAS